MRYGSFIIIFNLESDSEAIHNVQFDEETSYRFREYLDEMFSPELYGIGETLCEAFEDFKKKYYSY